MIFVTNRLPYDRTHGSGRWAGSQNRYLETTCMHLFYFYYFFGTQLWSGGRHTCCACSYGPVHRAAELTQGSRAYTRQLTQHSRDMWTRSQTTPSTYQGHTYVSKIESKIDNRKSTIESKIDNRIENRQSNRRSTIENRQSNRRSTIENRLSNRKSTIESKIDNGKSAI